MRYPPVTCAVCHGLVLLGDECRCGAVNYRCPKCGLTTTAKKCSKCGVMTLKYNAYVGRDGEVVPWPEEYGEREDT